MLSKQNPGQHQWEHRLVQPLRKPAGRIIKRLTLQLSYITAVYITQQCFLLHSRRKCNPYVEEFPESLPWKSENIAQPLHTRSQAKLKYSSTNIIYPQEPVSLSGTFIELLTGRNIGDLPVAALASLHPPQIEASHSYIVGSLAISLNQYSSNYNQCHVKHKWQRESFQKFR